MSASEEDRALMSAREEGRAPMSGASAEDFARASDAIEALLAAVRPDQWDAATPCEEWNLRQLADHLVEGTTHWPGASAGSAAAPPPIR
ncbi:uncharacterized Actinobacterial protein [Mycobacteroides abscessus]|nr:uncharacterized Actinobacterial protein [Mycobacteroides abscessus]